MLEKRSAVDSTEEQAAPNGAGRRFAIIASRWNIGFIEKLVAGAREGFTAANVRDEDVETFSVPGVFELPLAAKTAAETGRFDAVVAIGVVIRGDTPHFDFIAGEAARGIGEAALQTGIPILFGVITANDPGQVAERSGPGQSNKGYEAAMAAVEVAEVYEQIRSGEGPEKVDKAFPHVV